MKRPYACEAAGVLLMLAGAMALVRLFLPFINPGAALVSDAERNAGWTHYLYWIPVPLLILALAWAFNRKAARVRRSQNEIGL